MGEEEVAVFFIVVGIDLESGGLGTTLRGDACRGRFLLGDDGLQFEFAKLQVGTDTEEGTGTLDERGVGGEGHVARLHQFHNLILLALIAQLDVLAVEVEGGVGVVVQTHVHLVAHLTREVEVDFLVEVEGSGLAVADGQRGIVDVFQRGTQFEFGRSLGLDAHTTRTENLLCRTEVELHVREIKLLLALVGHILCILLAEEGLDGAFLAPFHILFGSHEDGGVEIGVTEFGTDEINAQRIVIDCLLLDVVGHAEVEGGGVGIGDAEGSRPADAPTGMQQGVGDGRIVSRQFGLRLGSRLPGVVVLWGSQRHHTEQTDEYIDESLQCSFLT